MKQDTFTMARYAEKPTFSSFLPGIAGEAGIPVWCYYNNRGQAVCSFGVSALKAAVHPEKHEFLYFVAVTDGGSHAFSKTLQEHNQAVRRYLQNRKK